MKLEPDIQTQRDIVQRRGQAHTDSEAHNSKGWQFHGMWWELVTAVLGVFLSGRPSCAGSLYLYYLPPRETRHLPNTSCCPQNSAQRRSLIHVCGLNETQAGPIPC